MYQQGGDNTISTTFNKAANVVDDINGVVKKVPVLGSVVGPIGDIFSDVGKGISSAFSWIGLGTHINHIEHRLGLPNHLTDQEREY